MESQTATASAGYKLMSERKVKTKQLQGREVDKHPLNTAAKATIPATTPITVPVTSSTSSSLSSSIEAPLGSSQLKGREASGDPLSSSLDFVDPLSPLHQKREKSDFTNLGGVNMIKDHLTNYVDETFLPWSTFCPQILQQYTTDDSNRIQVSFMQIGTSGKVKIPMNRLNKILEELELDKNEKEGELTQNDFIFDMETLHSELLKAWKTEERVRSLKIAIQTAKLLSDISLIKFYPSKFVIATEILDTFGNFVYDRIKKRLASSRESKTNEQFMREQAKETCRNWFNKISSIRELLPRLYVEISILKCYEFLQDDPNTNPQFVINRIINSIRGIGNPLVANYIRAYLSRRAFDLAPNYKKYIIQGLRDFDYAQRSFEKSKDITLKQYQITYTEYLGLYSPSLEWLLQCLAHNGTQETLEEVLSIFRESKNSLLLNHIISSFPPDYICNNSSMFSNFIKEADNVSYPKCKLYCTFGINLVLGHPPKAQILSILNDVWKVVTNFENLTDYITVAEVFIEYVLTHCSIKETDIFLKDILRHILPDKGFETIQSHLQSLVLKILTHIQDFNVLIGLTNFLPILDLFNGESQKHVSRSTLEVLSQTETITSDPIVINTFLTFGKALHDSLNSLSFQDEIRQVSQLIIGCINKIDFARDVEKQLNFYVDCRQNFSNFDTVKGRLVHAVLALCQRTHTLVKGKHTTKSTAFIRACIAYCFITIPSVDDIFMKLNLYLISASVALQNHALSQADALLKAAITFVQEIPPILEFKQVKSTEDWTIQFVGEFLSLLVVTPGHPENGPFYLVKALQKVIKDYPWERASSAKARIFTQMMALSSTWAQKSLPYHIERVESNDTLFTEDPEFSNELNEFYNSLIKDILAELNILKDEPDLSTQKKTVYVCIDLINMLLSIGELNNKSASLIYNLYNMAKKSISSTSFNEQIYLKNTLNSITIMDGKLSKELYSKLVQE